MTLAAVLALPIVGGHSFLGSGSTARAAGELREACAIAAHVTDLVQGRACEVPPWGAGSAARPR